MLQISEIIDAIEKKLKQTGLPASPSNLYEPASYMLSIGGKRIRPALSLIASQLYTDNLDSCFSTALSMEVFHNFTLMHDDIMDEAVLRRGMQSVHEKWNLNTAILSGDAMLVKSFEFLLSMKGENTIHAIRLFTDTALKVCEGQQLDMDYEARAFVSPEEYIEMITKKTAVLLGCSLYCGSIAGGASTDEANLLYDCGVQAGISFQIKDDVLDLYGDAASLGKRIGGDILRGKKTYLFNQCYQLADDLDKEELVSVYNNRDMTPENKIRTIKNLFERYRVSEQAEVEMKRWFESALALTQKLHCNDERKKVLTDFLQIIYARNY